MRLIVVTRAGSHPNRHLVITRWIAEDRCERSKARLAKARGARPLGRYPELPRTGSRAEAARKCDTATLRPRLSGGWTRFEQDSDRHGCDAPRTTSSSRASA